MKKAFRILILILFTINTALANMAQQYFEASLYGEPFIAENVDILREEIDIEIDSTFTYAKFKVKYHVEAMDTGLRIPMLFIALANDWERGEPLDFLVLMDGDTVQVTPVEEGYINPETGPLKGFTDGFRVGRRYEDSSQIWSQSINNYTSVRLEDLMKFEIDFTKGKHDIYVEYLSRCGYDLGADVKSSFFKYSLAPAKYWKSFGGATVRIFSDFKGGFTTNLGAPISPNEYHIKEIESDEIYIEYVPEISDLAKFLISVGPLSMAIPLMVLFIFLHWKVIVWFIKKHPEKNFSWPLVIGALLVPFLGLMSWVMANPVLQFVIGENAGNRGYYFMVIFLYPLVLLVYAPLMTVITRIKKNKFLKQKS